MNLKDTELKRMNILLLCLSWSTLVLFYPYYVDNTNRVSDRVLFTSYT